MRISTHHKMDAVGTQTILDLLSYTGWTTTGDVRRAYNAKVVPSHATRKWVQNRLKAAEFKGLVRSRRNGEQSEWQRVLTPPSTAKEQPDA